MPNLKLPASAVAQILKGNPKILGSSYSTVHFFFGVGFYDRLWQTRAVYQIKGTLSRNRCLYQKNTVFLLPHSEDRMILSSLVRIGDQRVTDRQTDGIAVANTALCIASNAAVL